MRRVPQIDQWTGEGAPRPFSPADMKTDPVSARLSAVRDDTARILALAEDLAGPLTGLDEATYQDKFKAFMAEYRTWILLERGMSDDREAWAERHSILLHLMVGGSTLGEAMAIFTRFAGPVWGPTTRFELVDEGRAIVLILDEARTDDAEGLVSALWQLSSVACQLEFLAGRRLENLSGQLGNRRSIPHEAARFLFGRPLEYQTVRSGIRIPKADAHRAVTASATQIPAFLKDYMRLTVNAERTHGMAQIVADMIWRNLNDGRRTPSAMPDIARALGISVSTLRRQLEDEGSSFKSLRTMVNDRSARTWLAETDWAVEQIADRIGYSDSFAFRRAFSRINGCSPVAYRKAMRAAG